MWIVFVCFYLLEILFTFAWCFLRTLDEEGKKVQNVFINLKSSNQKLSFWTQFQIEFFTIVNQWERVIGKTLDYRITWLSYYFVLIRHFWKFETKLSGKKRYYCFFLFACLFFREKTCLSNISLWSQRKLYVFKVLVFKCKLCV